MNTKNSTHRFIVRSATPYDDAEPVFLVNDTECGETIATCANNESAGLVAAALEQYEDGPTMAPRAEVQKFAELMEQKLRANDHKPGWKDDYSLDLFGRLAEEAEELHDAMRDWDHHRIPDDARRVWNEAADVANFAMMITDVTGGLRRG